MRPETVSISLLYYFMVDSGSGTESGGVLYCALKEELHRTNFDLELVFVT